MRLTVRLATPADVPELVALVNRIIALGGTTAHEEPFTPAKFSAYYLDDPGAICLHVAADEAGRLIGFQVLGRHDLLPPDWAEIGSFVDPDVQRSGAGAALFAATLGAARAAGVATFDATIRADNAAGLGYYAKRGFRDYADDPGYCLADGMRVGRISKRFDLG